MGEKSYQVLFFITLVGLVGALLGVFRVGRALPWDVIVTLGLVVIANCSAGIDAWRRISGVPYFYFAPARHIYPVDHPIWSAFLLAAGLKYSICSMSPGKGWFVIDRLAGSLAFSYLQTRVCVYNLAYTVLCFFALDCFSVISIAQYYGLLGVR